MRFSNVAKQKGKAGISPIGAICCYILVFAHLIKLHFYFSVIQFVLYRRQLNGTGQNLSLNRTNLPVLVDRKEIFVLLSFKHMCTVIHQWLSCV